MNQSTQLLLWLLGQQIRWIQHVGWHIIQDVISIILLLSLFTQYMICDPVGHTPSWWITKKYQLYDFKKLEDFSARDGSSDGMEGYP